VLTLTLPICGVSNLHGKDLTTSTSLLDRSASDHGVGRFLGVRFQLRLLPVPASWPFARLRFRCHWYCLLFGGRSDCP